MSSLGQQFGSGMARGDGVVGVQRHPGAMGDLETAGVSSRSICRLEMVS